MLRPEFLPPASSVRAGGVTLAFEMSGASRRPLVLVHGYTGSRLDFMEVRRPLMARRRVLGYDHRGHGDSEHRGPYTVARLVRDLEALLDALGEEEVDLLGHSMGGMVALRWALARPRRVRTLTLMSTTAGRYTFEVLPPAGPPPLGARLRQEARRLLRRDPAREMARALAAPADVRVRYEHVVRRGHSRVDPAAAHQLALDFSRMPSVEAELGRYPGPTLVLVGQKDTPFRGPSETLAAGLPAARLEVLEGAGHYPHIEAREAWLELLDAHLSRA